MPEIGRRCRYRESSSVQFSSDGGPGGMAWHHQSELRCDRPSDRQRERTQLPTPARGDGVPDFKATNTTSPPAEVEEDEEDEDEEGESNDTRCEPSKPLVRPKHVCTEGDDRGDA